MIDITYGFPVVLEWPLKAHIFPPLKPRIENVQNKLGNA